jgi:hypothetical protein
LTPFVKEAAFVGPLRVALLPVTYASGNMIMSSSSFTAVPAPPAPRKRGRPRKKKTVADAAASATVKTIPVKAGKAGKVAKKKRGRTVSFNADAQQADPGTDVDTPSSSPRPKIGSKRKRKLSKVAEDEWDENQVSSSSNEEIDSEATEDDDSESTETDQGESQGQSQNQSTPSGESEDDDEATESDNGSENEEEGELDISGMTERQLSRLSVKQGGRSSSPWAQPEAAEVKAPKRSERYSGKLKRDYTDEEWIVVKEKERKRKEKHLSDIEKEKYAVVAKLLEHTATATEKEKERRIKQRQLEARKRRPAVPTHISYLSTSRATQGSALEALSASSSLVSPTNATDICASSSSSSFAAIPPVTLSLPPSLGHTTVFPIASVQAPPKVQRCANCSNPRCYEHATSGAALCHQLACFKAVQAR